MGKVFDFGIYRKLKKLREENAVIRRALAAVDYGDKALARAILKEYDDKNK